MSARRLARLVSLTIAVSLPLLGTAAGASAKARPAGCHKTHTCNKGGGTATAPVTGGAPVQMTVEVDPNPLVETGQSEVHAVIQVETLPSFAGATVNIDSSQLTAACGGIITFRQQQPAGISRAEDNHIGVVLDDDGNVTVTVEGELCAPGTSVIEADLESAPYLTALTTLTALPPVVTPAGVTGYPSSEVETGDTTASGDSNIFAVFYVETSPAYAEQEVEISSPQLEARCGLNSNIFTGNFTDGLSGDSGGTGGSVGPPAFTTLDDDGNAVFIFQGSSCAAGTSEVIADVEAGTHPTYTTTFTVLPPQPTI